VTEPEGAFSAAPGTDPEKRRLRRIGGIVVLAVGLLAGSRLLGETWPREQVVVFRLPSDLAEVATHLDASFTRVGEREPAHGLSLSLHPGGPRDLRERISLPGGEYIVALELTYGNNAGPSAPKKSETSRARRVRLDGEETLVVFDAEGPE
jgi:hypothetical protein